MACLLLCLKEVDRPDPVQGLQAVQGASGFGEPDRVVSPPGRVHGRVFRQEREYADAADHQDAQSEFLDGGLRTQAPRVHRVRGCRRPLEHRRRGGEDGRILAVRTPAWLVIFASALS